MRLFSDQCLSKSLCIIHEQQKKEFLAVMLLCEKACLICLGMGCLCRSLTCRAVLAPECGDEAHAASCYSTVPHRMVRNIRLWTRREEQMQDAISRVEYTTLFEVNTLVSV